MLEIKWHIYALINCSLWRNILDVWDKTVELKLSKSAFRILKTALG